MVSIGGPSPLDVLSKCSNDDLGPLVEYILTAEWTNTLEVEPEFEKHHPDHSKYVVEIANEVREFGGNTVRNMFRGEGPLYREVVRDVALRLKVRPKPPKNATIEEMEAAILKTFMEKAYEGMTESEQADFVSNASKAAGVQVPYEAGVPLFVLLSQVGIQMSGFYAYQTAVIVANAVAKSVLGRGLTLAANTALTRGVSVFAGPIGWVLGGLWLAIDLAGPAYRVTIPCVVHIAFLRQKLAYEAATGGLRDVSA